MWQFFPLWSDPSLFILLPSCPSAVLLPVMSSQISGGNVLHTWARSCCLSVKDTIIVVVVVIIIVIVIIIKVMVIHGSSMCFSPFMFFCVLCVCACVSAIGRWWLSSIWSTMMFSSHSHKLSGSPKSNYYVVLEMSGHTSVHWKWMIDMCCHACLLTQQYERLKFLSTTEKSKVVSS